MNLSDAGDEDEEEEDDDEELDALGREAVEEGEESSFFGGDGVRGLTSTTLRLSADNDAAEVEELLDSSTDTAGAADEEDLAERPSSRGDEARGDTDRERGTTSTTFDDADEDALGAATLSLERGEDILDPKKTVL